MEYKQAILITGCDSGFGFSLALHLAEKHQFIILACIYESESEGAKILKSHPEIHVLKADVTNTKSIEQLKEKVDVLLEQEKAQLWTLVNNAATLVFAEAVWQTTDMVKNQFLGMWPMSSTDICLHF